MLVKVEFFVFVLFSVFPLIRGHMFGIKFLRVSGVYLLLVVITRAWLLVPVPAQLTVCEDSPSK